MDFIDLRSDTVTMQTKEMIDAMIHAKVGDDVYGEDDSVNELEKYAANLVGKEAGLFVTSGTFGNQVSILTHTKRGNEVILDDSCHIIQHEASAGAVISGVQFRTVESENGILDPEKVLSKIRTEKDIHYPETALICLENAHSLGKVIPISIMEKIYQGAKKYNIKVHLDGARLFNAATSLNVDAKEITKYCDSVSFCLSKGLCAPIGSVVCSDADFIERARKNRKIMGGGMRQAGYMAAPGLYALKNMTKRLHEDHEMAKYLAKELLKIPGVLLNMDDVEINMVFLKIDTKKDIKKLREFMLKEGIKISGPDLNIFRFVTHYFIRKEHVDKTIKVLKDFLG
ncbi:MAG: low-specificity L-threonine aldolase [Oscillospiraceae bacterium]|nr:low-specificity L-threonine aldolase [Oscillospiraceae bacterium]